MKTISVTLDDEIYEKAEQKAGALSTSVSQIAADYVERWATEAASLAEARREMMARFAKPNWQFSIGRPDDRHQRNTRG
jgi:hypothetical protein